MSYYLEILSVQRPFPIGLDNSNRPMFSVNFTALCQGITLQWEEELLKILQDAGLVIPSTNAFIGSAVTLPSGSGPYTSIIDTGGTAPLETHNGTEYSRLSAQIIVRASTYSAARSKILAIWQELKGKRSITVNV